MRVDITLANFTAKNVVEFGVLLGEKFRLEIKDEANPVEWFTNRDRVLQLDENGMAAEVVAASVGQCEIQIQQGGGPVHRLLVEVFAERAASLGLASGEPEQK